MLVQTFHNTGEGYRLSYEGYAFDSGNTFTVLEEVFAFLNSDERPNRMIRPSLSAGDLVTLTGGPRRLRESYIVATAGFKRDGYRFASIAERLEYKVEQRESGVPNNVRIPRFPRSA